MKKLIKITFMITVIFMFTAILSFSQNQNKTHLKVIFGEPVVMGSLNIDELFKLSFIQEYWDKYNNKPTSDDFLKKIDFNIKHDLKSVSYALPIDNALKIVENMKSEDFDDDTFLEFGYIVVNATYKIDKIIEYAKELELQIKQDGPLYYFEEGEGAIVFFKDFIIVTGSKNKDNVINGIKNDTKSAAEYSNVNNLIEQSNGNLAYGFINLKNIKGFLELFKKEADLEELKETGLDISAITKAIEETDTIIGGAKINSDNVDVTLTIKYTSSTSAATIKKVIDFYMDNDDAKYFINQVFKSFSVDQNANDILIKFTLTNEMISQMAISEGFLPDLNDSYTEEPSEGSASRPDDYENNE